MYTKEQIQNAIERYNSENSAEIFEEDFFDQLDKEVLFTT